MRPATNIVLPDDGILGLDNGIKLPIDFKKTTWEDGMRGTSPRLDRRQFMALCGGVATSFAMPSLAGADS
ncbi:MAG: hypothetical protein ABW175_03365, partial [Bradyrhizobium sp.]